MEAVRSIEEVNFFHVKVGATLAVFTPRMEFIRDLNPSFTRWLSAMSSEWESAFNCFVHQVLARSFKKSHIFNSYSHKLSDLHQTKLLKRKLFKRSLLEQKLLKRTLLKHKLHSYRNCHTTAKMDTLHTQIFGKFGPYQPDLTPHELHLNLSSIQSLIVALF